MILETRIVAHTAYVLDVGSNLIYLGQDDIRLYVRTHLGIDVLDVL